MNSEHTKKIIIELKKEIDKKILEDYMTYNLSVSDADKLLSDMDAIIDNFFKK